VWDVLYDLLFLWFVDECCDLLVECSVGGY